LWFGALIAVGCDPITPADRAFFEERDRTRSQREVLLRKANASVASDDVIQQVRQSPAPAGAGTVENWLPREFQRLRGQVMFPRWSAVQRGSNKQEVMFQFILIDEQNQMKRLAYIWDVDVLNMEIGAPRLQQLEEVASRDRFVVQQAERRIREHEKELE
jgi:hypothetical protein